jgi:chemotaxis protein histidine kinase CheA
MEEEVGVKVGITVDGSATLKSMKQELKEAQGQALALSRQFGELSPEAQAAAKRVAELKDEIGDLNERIDLMDPGNKFAAFGNAVKGVTGGFTAAQGALATFGAESEDLTKTLVKLQGAMALSEGLSTISDSWKDFQRLGNVIKTQVVNAFTTLKGAIIATGLGALAVAIGLIIANFDKIEAKIQELFPAFEGFGKLFGKLKAVAMGALNGIIESFKVVGEIIVDIFSGDFSEAIDTAKSAGNRIGKAYVDGFNEEVADQIQEAARKATEALIKRQENDLKILKSYGEKRKNEADALELEIAKNKVRITKDGTAEEREAQAAAFTELQALQISQAEAAKEESKKRAEEAKAARDKKFQEDLAALKFQQEQETKVLTIQGKDTFLLRELQLEAQKELYRKFHQDLTEINRAIAEEELNQRIALNTALAEIDEQFNQRRKDGLLGVAAAQQVLLDQQSAAQDDINKKEQESAAIKEQAEAAKRAALSVTADALGAASQLAGEQTAAGKGLAIAQTTISTYTGAQSAFTALAGIPIVGPALGAIAAAAAIVSGITNVKRIVSVKTPGAVSSSPSISNAANGVQMPSVSGSADTMINQLDQMNSNLRQPQRVYVLETYITFTQDRVAKIEANAQF